MAATQQISTNRIMTQNRNNNNNFWTQKHQELCLKFGIKGAAQLLWHWLIHYGQAGKQIEPDLSEFNAWVEKERGKGFSAKHLKNIFAKLLDCGLIKLVKQYTWKVFKLIVKPLDWLEPLRKKLEQKSQKLTNTSNLAAETPENSSEKFQEVNQQQQLISSVNTHVSNETKEKIQQLCITASIHLPEKCEVYYYPIEKIFIAVNFLLLRNKRDVVDNRIGWLIDCLRWEYWNEPENKRLLQHKGVITKDSPFYEYYV